MESVGVFPEGDWESLGKMFSQEDVEFSPHFLGQCSFNPNHSHNNSSTFEGIMFPNCENSSESLFHTLESLNSDLQFLSQESSYSNANSGNQESYYFSTDHHSSHLMPIFLMDHQCNNNISLFDDNHVNMGDQSMCDNTNNVNEDFGTNHLKRSYVYEDQSNTATESSQNPKKKPRVQKSRKNAKSQTNAAQKGKIEEENSNTTSSYSSEDDNASQENINNGDETPDGKAVTAVNLNGKARASRGAATDPQSLYARKRRERINERLRILQNLVPNGTKVDISTMLEEAVQYVKFLQLQIKLLSSDDMWMYAPLAYNGMDIGLNKKLSQLV